MRIVDRTQKLTHIVRVVNHMSRNRKITAKTLKTDEHKKSKKFRQFVRAARWVPGSLFTAQETNVLVMHKRCWYRAYWQLSRSTTEVREDWGKTDTAGVMAIMKMKTALLNEYEERAACRQINSDWACSYSFCHACVCGKWRLNEFSVNVS